MRKRYLSDSDEKVSVLFESMIVFDCMDSGHRSKKELCRKITVHCASH